MQLQQQQQAKSRPQNSQPYHYGIASCWIFLILSLQDDMRRLQMERFRRLLVNFDDDISGSPGNDDDDGEVEV